MKIGEPKKLYDPLGNWIGMIQEFEFNRDEYKHFNGKERFGKTAEEIWDTEHGVIPPDTILSEVPPVGKERELHDLQYGEMADIWPGIKG